MRDLAPFEMGCSNFFGVYLIQIYNFIIFLKGESKCLSVDYLLILKPLNRFMYTYIGITMVWSTENKATDFFFISV